MRRYIMNRGYFNVFLLISDMEVSFRESSGAEPDSDHNEQRKFVCSFCGKNFQHKQSMVRHENGFYKKIYQYQCRECPKGFHKRREFTEHVLCHAGTKPERCDICSTKFSSRRALLKHKKGCVGEKKEIKCDTCDAKFQTANGLQDHKNAKHGLAKYQCDTCQKSYRWRSSLKYHKEHSH